MSDQGLNKDAHVLANVFKDHEAKEREKKAIVEEINDKSLEIRKFEVENKYKKVSQAKNVRERFEKLNFNFQDKDRLANIIKSNTRYLENARKRSMQFLTADFKEVVPYQPGQLILVGARTGKGKSTTSANLAYRALNQGKKVLVLSNEEKAGDVYNRVTSLIKNKPYTLHSDMTEEDIKMYNEYIGILGQRMSVVDDDAVGDVGGMSIFEVVRNILVDAVSKKKCDVIIIDYYQKIDQSVDQPDLDVYKVQHKFASFIGDLIKDPDCPPIVLMCQLKPDDKDGKPFEERIEGRKIIVKPVTCMLEARPVYDAWKTEFLVHKTRFSEHNGKVISVGFLKGKYVPYTPEFIQFVEQEKMRIQQKKMDAQRLSSVKPTNGD